MATQKSIDFECLNSDEKLIAEIDMMFWMTDTYQSNFFSTVPPSVEIHNLDFVRLSLHKNSYNSNPSMAKYDGCLARVLRVHTATMAFRGSNGTRYRNVPITIVADIEIVENPKDSSVSFVGEKIGTWRWGWYHFNEIIGGTHMSIKLNKRLPPPGIPF